MRGKVWGFEVWKDGRQVGVEEEWGERGVGGRGVGGRGVGGRGWVEEGVGKRVGVEEGWKRCREWYIVVVNGV